MPCLLVILICGVSADRVSADVPPVKLFTTRLSRADSASVRIHISTIDDHRLRMDGKHKTAIAGYQSFDFVGCHCSGPWRSWRR